MQSAKVEVEVQTWQRQPDGTALCLETGEKWNAGQWAAFVRSCQECSSERIEKVGKQPEAAFTNECKRSL